MFLMQKANAQNPYRVASESQIKISIDSNKTSLHESNSFSAQGSFIFKNGELDDVSSFDLVMPMNKSAEDLTATKDSISFKLTHVMVLPIMKKIHIVGFLNVAGVSTRTDFDFSFIVNADQTITMNGDKFIKLSDYRNETTTSMVSYLSNNDELKLSMNLIFKNDPVKEEQVFAKEPIFKSEQVSMLTSR